MFLKTYKSAVSSKFHILEILRIFILFLNREKGQRPIQRFIYLLKKKREEFSQCNHRKFFELYIYFFRSSPKTIMTLTSISVHIYLWSLLISICWIPCNYFPNCTSLVLTLSSFTELMKYFFIVWDLRKCKIPPDQTKDSLYPAEWQTKKREIPGSVKWAFGEEGS